MQLAVWPGFEQPGRAARHGLLLLAVGPLLGAWVLSARAASATPRLLASALALPLLSGLAGWLGAAAAERPSVLQDLLVLVAMGCVALLASGLPACSRESGADRRAAGVVVAALLVVAALGLAESWLGWTSPVAVRRPGATYVSRNVAAQALVVMLPLAASGVVAFGRTWARSAAGIASAAGLMLLIATRSRGSWIAIVLAAAATMVVLAVAARRRVPWRWVAAGAAGAAVLVSVASFVPIRGVEPLPSVKRSLELLVEQYEGSTLQIREKLWRNTVAAIPDAPLLGFGAGRFPVVYPLYHRAAVDDEHFGLDRQPVHVHNDLLERALELGIPAAAVLLALVVGAAVLTVREMSRTGSGEQLALLAGRFAALAGVCAHGMVSFPWGSAGSAVLAWWLLGRGWSGRAGLRWPTRHRRTRLAAGLLATAATGLSGVVLSVGLLGAQSALGAALDSHGRRDLREAAQHARVAADRAWHRHELGLAAALVWTADPRAEPSLRVLEPALAAHPHHLNLLLDTGARRLKAGRARDARQAFEHAVEIAPDLSRGWLGVAMSALELGDRRGATRACARAVRDPQLPAARTFCFGNRLLEPPPRSR
jgi:tetratricopeptide (TPR) repeat protein